MLDFFKKKVTRTTSLVQLETNKSIKFYSQDQTNKLLSILTEFMNPQYVFFLKEAHDEAAAIFFDLQFLPVLNAELISDDQIKIALKNVLQKISERLLSQRLFRLLENQVSELSDFNVKFLSEESTQIIKELQKEEFERLKRLPIEELFEKVKDKKAIELIKALLDINEETPVNISVNTLLTALANDHSKTGLEISQLLGHYYKESFRLGQILNFENKRVHYIWEKFTNKLKLILNEQKYKVDENQLHQIERCFTDFISRLIEIKEFGSAQAIHNFLFIAKFIVTQRAVSKIQTEEEAQTYLAPLLGPSFIEGLKLTNRIFPISSDKKEFVKVEGQAKEYKLIKEVIIFLLKSNAFNKPMEFPSTRLADVPDNNNNKDYMFVDDSSSMLKKESSPKLIRSKSEKKYVSPKNELAFAKSQTPALIFGKTFSSTSLSPLVKPSNKENVLVSSVVNENSKTKENRNKILG